LPPFSPKSTSDYLAPSPDFARDVLPGFEEEGRGAFKEQGEGSATNGGGGGEQTSSRKRFDPSTQSRRLQQRHGNTLRRPRKQFVPNTQPLCWYDSFFKT
jgi:hypothetical protein